MNNKIIKINTDQTTQTKEIEHDDPYDLINEDFIKFKSGNKLTISDMKKLSKWLKSDSEINELYSDEFENKYKDVKKKYNEIDQKEIVLNSGEIVPYPNSDTREVLYIAGASGSGKSTYTAKYIEQYKKAFPKNKVYVFSRLEEDIAFDNLKIIRIKLNDEILDDPIQTSELSNSLCIFDDIATIPDEEIKKTVLKLRDDILETGRHNNIYVVNTEHLMMNYKYTRTLLNESSHVTFFNGSSKYHIIRFLKTYCGLDKQQIDRILKLPSRWVTICRNYPQYILYSSGVYIL
jgi:hypothetical protein